MNPVNQAIAEKLFIHLRNYSAYKTLENITYLPDYAQMAESGKEIPDIEQFRPMFLASLSFLDELKLQGQPDDEPTPPDKSAHRYSEPATATPDVPPTLQDVRRYHSVVHAALDGENAPVSERQIADVIEAWRQDYLRWRAGGFPDSPPGDGDPMTATQAKLRNNGTAPKRSGPRDGPRDIFPIHSSAPVYDIGETIARGSFTLPDGGNFPTAEIVGSTQGRIELLPFWDHENNRPLTPQHINLAASTGTSEFTRMQEQAVAIATSYNEEMATYFYAMDAFWLMHAKSADDYIELDISDLLQYTGKKPVKTHGKYTGTYRPDQLKRAGMMVYGMGFSMVEIERAIVKGVGERAHYKRLWDVSDMYVMETLDGESYIESMTYRPNEFFRGVSFGSRRETALLMSKVLGLDYEKMVTARRLGRYYTWLWRDRAYSGNIAAPIACARLLERAGVVVEKGKERYARRSLETALDRLEVEGIISQWVLLDREGNPADTSERIAFKKWAEMKISVSPPDTILTHYASGSLAPAAHLPERPALDVERLRSARRRLGYTLAMLSEETGVELSTLSRIAGGKTKRPRAEHVKAINTWLEKIEKEERDAKKDPGSE